ncbi:MAG TPA: recombinase family protein [Candidatus Acidoferrales bacterium]|nr:recombinase family protein [Candidatus Acidoferrales bacterium]
MTDGAHQKVNAGHLKRNAYLYVRQSTLRQVFENTESTKRQYGLRQRAVSLGWPVERIIVIDCDLGQSGASAVDREGFQKLVTEVSLGKAGIVLGLEVSRLARNSTDWHRLLEICALTATLILDEDGVYDPSHFNDRLLLGLKGTMSEAELHVLRARLQGGILNKASRGELQCPLPVGFVYNVKNEPVLDPDKQVQESLRYFFETFRRTGSACGIVKTFRQKGLLFPRRLKKGPNKGDLVWAELPHSRTLHILHNPRYAGAFVYGRSRTRNNLNGGTSYTRLPREQWTLLKSAHPGYISWEQYEENLRRLRENAQAIGADRRKSPPREGPALLQGLVVCGVCGSRMTVRYHARQQRLVPEYVCQRDGIEHAVTICQRVVGDHIDNAVGHLLVESVAPLALDVTLSVQQELQARIEEVDKLRKKQVERARYEADLAQRRYLHVDPANRLVADSLEADWNQKLRALTEAQEQYEQQRRQDSATVDEQQRARIAALASDFPQLWQDPNTPDRERKRMVRLLLADVTLIRGKRIAVHVRFNGGATKTLDLPRPLTAWELRTTPAEIVAEVDRLTDDYTDKQIVEILNERGTLSGCGQRFNSRIIARLRREYQLKPRYDRLREKSLLTLEEISALLDIGPKCVITWRNHGLLRGHPVNDRDDWLYEHPGPNPPRKAPGVKLAKRRVFPENVVCGSQEVQYEA